MYLYIYEYLYQIYQLALIKISLDWQVCVRIVLMGSGFVLRGRKCFEHTLQVRAHTCTTLLVLSHPPPRTNYSTEQRAAACNRERTSTTARRPSGRSGTAPRGCSCRWRSRGRIPAQPRHQEERQVERPVADPLQQVGHPAISM